MIYKDFFISLNDFNFTCIHYKKIIFDVQNNTFDFGTYIKMHQI